MDKRLVNAVAYTLVVLVVIIATLILNNVISGLLYLTIQFWSVEVATTVFKNCTSFLIVLECLVYLCILIINLLPDKKK